MMCAIIPTLNSAPCLGDLLGQLGPHVNRIVITDGGSVDETLTVATWHGARLASGSSGRGSQLRRGSLWGGECEWFLFLHADSKLPDTAFAKINHHIQNHSDKAGYFDLRFDSSHAAARILEWLVYMRCQLFGLPYGDQGLLISKTLYEDIGGYPEVPLFEDVAIVRALGKDRLRSIGLPILTNAAKYERDGFFRRGWRNFRLLRRYLRGEPPEDLVKAYT